MINLRVAMWGGWSRNYGDLAILESQCRLIQEARSDIRFTFTPINSDIAIDESHVPIISKQMVNFLNIQHIFMIGAGGQIMPRPPDHSVSGYQVNITDECLNEIKIPIWVQGVGVNLFPNQEDAVSKTTVEHLRKLHRRANHFSVRDSLSRDWFVAQGMPVRYLHADPALFCEGLTNVPAPGNGLRIGLNWAGDRLYSRYGANDIRDIVKRLCDQIVSAMGETEFTVVYFPHTMYDVADYHKFKECLGDRVVSIHNVYPELFPESLWGTSTVVGLYGKMDLVIGTRWHSVVLPYSKRVPCITYGRTFKNVALSRDLPGVPCVDLFNDELSSAIVQAFENREELATQAQGYRDQERIRLLDYYTNVLDTYI